jgi:hypothetical protein
MTAPGSDAFRSCETKDTFAYSRDKGLNQKWNTLSPLADGTL